MGDGNTEKITIGIREAAAALRVIAPISAKMPETIAQIVINQADIKIAMRIGDATIGATLGAMIAEKVAQEIT